MLRRALVTAVTLLVLGGSTPGLAADAVRLWERRDDGPPSLRDVAVAVVASPDAGSVFVAATSRGYGTGSDILLVARDAGSGDRRWSRRIDAPGTARVDDEARALAIDPAGRWIVVAGISWTGAEPDTVVVAFDARTGERRWTTRMPDTDVADVAVSADGACVVVAATEPGGGGVYDRDVTFAALRARDGALALRRTFGSPGANSIDLAAALAVTGRDVTVVITGTSIRTAATSQLTLAWRLANGALRWVRREAPGDGVDVVAAPSGRWVAVTGRAGGDIRTVCYAAATGARRWTRVFVGPGGPGDDDPEAIAVTPAGGRVVIAGVAWTRDDGYDYLTIAYDAADGARAWQRRAGGPGYDDDLASAVAIAANGVAVVTGVSPGTGGDDDLFTVAYRIATGELTWSDRYDGPAGGGDRGVAAAAGPFGAVYLTGSSAGVDTGEDVVTIAYAA